MPIYNQVQTETITNGGGTINLACGNSTTTRYVFSGTATLAANWVIQPSGTPLQGMEFDIRWQSVCTIGANSVTIFGTALTADQALNDLIITCYYNGSAWDVDINEDSNGDLWEVGSGGSTTAKLKASSGTTVTDLGAVSVGNGCTSSGENSFTANLDNIASGNQSTSFGFQTTASGAASISEGDRTIASGSISHAEGSLTIASEGVTHAGGLESIAGRYGQISRASGRYSGLGLTDYMQWSKLTLWEYTTGGSAMILKLDGGSVGSRLTIPPTSIVAFKGHLIAHQLSGASGSPGDNATWYFNGTISNVAGTTALVDSVLYQDGTGAWGASAQRSQVANASTWLVSVAADNVNDALEITVTGQANKNIAWLCSIELTEILLSA